MKKTVSALAISLFFLALAAPALAGNPTGAVCNDDQSCTPPDTCVEKVCTAPNNGFSVALPNPLCLNSGDSVCSVASCNSEADVEACCSLNGGDLSTTTCVKDFPTLLSTIATYVTGLIASIAVLVFMYAGFLYLTSAGSPDKIAKANKAVLYAVIGIAIALAGAGLVAVITAVVGEGPK